VARLLIRAIDNINPGPALDVTEMFKAGDIVRVEEDGHVWGSAEGVPGFLQVDLPVFAVDFERFQLPVVEQIHDRVSGDLFVFKEFFVELYNDFLNGERPRRFMRQRRYRYNIGSGLIEDKTNSIGIA